MMTAKLLNGKEKEIIRTFLFLSDKQGSFFRSESATYYRFLDNVLVIKT
jgi:hypothetical protein